MYPKLLYNASGGWKRVLNADEEAAAGPAWQFTPDGKPVTQAAAAALPIPSAPTDEAPVADAASADATKKATTKKATKAA